LEPPRLQELVDLAERPRHGGWSLRAGLCRYAQPQPVRAGAVHSLARRLETALTEQVPALRASGEIVLASLESGGDAVDPAHARPLALLRVAVELDELGDEVAAWAVDRAPERPDAAVDAVVERVTAGLAELGVPEEPTEPPRGARSRG
jgi:hypothetical protein